MKKIKVALIGYKYNIGCEHGLVHVVTDFLDAKDKNQKYLQI